MPRSSWLVLLMLVAIPAAFVGCSGGGGGNNGGGGGLDPLMVEVAARLDGVLKTGLNTITADAFSALFFDGDPTNDPFILDTREAADFALGHVPGAVNVPLLEFPSRYLNEGAALIPANQNVAVVSYAGGDGNMASLLINAVRITDPANFANFPWSKTMFMGMQTWTFDKSLANNQRYPDDLGFTRVEAATEATPNAGGAFPYSGITPTPAQPTVEDNILILADAYFQGFATQFEGQFTPIALQALLDNGDPNDDPQVLSVRSGTHYALGHIPSATNIGWKDVAEPANFMTLDPSEPLVAYCYTGHTGTLATMALGILGYDVVNLLYGINGWNTSSSIASGQLGNFDTNRGWDFPNDDGGPGDLVSLVNYTPPTGCLECHSSLTGIFYDLTVNAPVAMPPPPSVGEG